MKNILREFLTFNKRERNGVFILLSIIFVLVLYLNISSNFISAEKVDFSEFDADVQVFLESGKGNEPDTDPGNMAADRTRKFDAERFPFDPNHLPAAEWRRLGLSDKQISSIKKYESKGGKFKRKTDLKKMYCISEEQYLSLEAYIQIASGEKILITEQKVPDMTPANSEGRSPLLNVERLPVVELNSADSAQLCTIKGIGAFYARNIIKHRNSIGGFVSKEQLLEVWKFDQEKLASIEKYISVDASLVKKVNINTCEAIDLKSGYLSWTIAKGIVNYRKNHGNYKTVDEIRKTDLVDEETYRKIAPYLVIGD